MLFIFVHLCFKITDTVIISNGRSSVSSVRSYRGSSPTAVRPSDPALCGSCPL